MKKLLVFLCALFLLLGMAGISGATLWDRGGGLIYDDVLDITWLQDANYAQTSGYDTDGRMTWVNAVAWADQLVYGGYDDWRLPDAHNQDGSGPDSGYDVTDSEMGYMFYNNLGGSALSFPGADFIDGYDDPVSFLNLQSSIYRSGTQDSSDSGNAWYFSFQYGYQNVTDNYYLRYAWAVRPGDVSAVPVPATMLLFGSGLAGLGVFRRKIRRRHG